VALVLVGLVWDLRATATVAHPFAASPIAAGEPFTAEVIDWRPLPAGAFAVPDLIGGVAAVDLESGDPVIASVVAGPIDVPEGWWAVPIDMARRSPPGTPVLLVVTDPPLTIPGMVVTAQRGDRFSMDHSPAVVAVPGEMAPLVAAAERAGLLVTATRP
jgi:hypothetical protein